MARPLRERLRIHARAKELLGLKVKQTDHYIYMTQCIDQLTLEGEDDDRARDICQLLWEEGADLSEFD